MKLLIAATLATLLVAPVPGTAQPSPAAFDPALAARLGADERGMRPYVLVILKTGPSRMPAGPERDAMFRGHFANMKRLTDEGKLVMAGPLDGVEGRRGIFVFAVKDVEEARQLSASDPVLIHGEMVAEYHRLYSSAALRAIPETHERVVRKAN